MDLDQVTILYRVRKTVLQMLKDRGYLVSEKKLAQTRDEFAATFNMQRASLNMLVTKRKPEGAAAGTELGGQDKIFVFFPDSEKMSDTDVKKISLTMIDNLVNNAIVIIKGTTQVSRKVSR